MNLRGGTNQTSQLARMKDKSGVTDFYDFMMYFFHINSFFITAKLVLMGQKPVYFVKAAE